jgi:hypothetical protein
MALREEDKRQVVAILRQHGGVQHGKAAAAAAKLTEKQQLALLAEYREKVQPLRKLAAAALAAALVAAERTPEMNTDKAVEPAPAPVPADTSNEDLNA